MVRIRFWGTRGSLATPGPTTLRYGGNTSCVEVRPADGTLIVLDCGTGAHRFGQALLASAGPPVCGHLLITHTHWDHIQDSLFLRRSSLPAVSGISMRQGAGDTTWRPLWPGRWSTRIFR